jgi:hypothetical protein
MRGDQYQHYNPRFAKSQRKLEEWQEIAMELVFRLMNLIAESYQDYHQQFPMSAYL